MTTAITIAIILSGIAYVGIVIKVTAGFRRLMRAENHVRLGTEAPGTEAPRVSVVVAARDEVTNVRECVEAILANEYPRGRFELIVVDDGSSDGTTRLLSVMAARRSDAEPRLAVYRLHGSAHGKGAALEAGVMAATGEIILTTDADCLVPPTWISSMVGAFGPEVGFVAGPVANRDVAGHLSQVEALEFLSLVGFGAGSIGLGRPTICNSANAAYRRSLFVDWCSTRRRSSVPASDELVMHHVQRETEYQVSFCASRGAMVQTSGASSLRALLIQRSRWASSVPSFPASVIALGMVVYIFFASVIVGAIGLVINPWLAIPVIGGMTTKVLVDRTLLSIVSYHLGKGHLMRYFMAAELLHIPYVVAVSAAGLIGKPAWKGRKVTAETMVDDPTLKPVYVHD